MAGPEKRVLELVRLLKELGVTRVDMREVPIIHMARDKFFATFDTYPETPVTVSGVAVKPEGGDPCRSCNGCGGEWFDTCSVCGGGGSATKKGFGK